MTEGNHQNFFDIETGPLPIEELEAMIPEFNPDDVKLGNLKDPAKIEIKLAEAKAKHRQDFIDKAALDPMTGHVIAIGFMDNESGEIEIDAVDAEKCAPTYAMFTELTPFGKINYYPSEKALLEAFLAKVSYAFCNAIRLVGFNIFPFDLPFLIKRAWHHKLRVSRLQFRPDRYWAKHFIDLCEIWQCGDWKGHGSLGRIAKFLGLPGKSGSGKFFSELYVSDRNAAIDYLCHDLIATRSVSHGFGFAVPEPEPAGASVKPGDY